MNAKGDAEEFVFYEVLMTQEAEEDYRRVSHSPRFPRVNVMLDILEGFPGVGRVYDPQYEAANLPDDARVAYADIYGIYYLIDEAKRAVIVLAIEDQRSDPMLRFS